MQVVLRAALDSDRNQCTLFLQQQAQSTSSCTHGQQDPRSTLIFLYIYAQDMKPQWLGEEENNWMVWLLIIFSASHNTNLLPL